MLYYSLVGNTFLNQLDDIVCRASQNPKSDARLFEAIVNAPFHDKIRATEMDLGIVVLLLVNRAAGTIDRIALSDTEQAAGAVKMSEKPFKEIRIPVGYKDNLIAEAIETGRPQYVSDWKFLFAPALGSHAARFNQAGGGIEFSAVYPLKARGGGALIFSFYQIHANIGAEQYSLMEQYAALVDKYLSA